jgi:L-amino acid N-acyltransferase YncA
VVFGVGVYLWACAWVWVEASVKTATHEICSQGLATEALQLMMEHGRAKHGIQRFVAKILSHNHQSLQLFQQKLGFRLFEEVECFGEFHFELVRNIQNESSIS